jgi:ubiquinone/menaquinone biosynthesis C-methylase UbiE
LYAEFVFKERNNQLELIDTGNYTSEEYEGFLREIRFVNRWLGDVRALRETLLQEIKDKKAKQFTVLDVGAGSGELLRVMADFARKEKLLTKLFGLELNERSAEAIVEESKDYAEISSVRGNALALPFADKSIDYSICSLFTHHFTDESVVKILSEMCRVSKEKIFVIDLHRHPTPYYLYITLGKLVLYNRLVRHDGALSILRSFVPEELVNLGKQAGLQDVQVTKHFPSRLVLSGKT